MSDADDILESRIASIAMIAKIDDLPEIPAIMAILAITRKRDEQRQIHGWLGPDVVLARP